MSSKTSTALSNEIPTYQLSVFTNNEAEKLDVFFIDRKLEIAPARIDVPYRSNFYAVGVCLRGEAELKANLENYVIKPGSLVVKPAYVIQQWTRRSDDFESLTICFTKEFVADHNGLNLDKFEFFESTAKHVFPVSAEDLKNVKDSLKVLQQKYYAPHPFRDEILQNLISVLLYEIASIYERLHLSSNSAQTRSDQIASEFKKLLNENFTAERNLKFYAAKLLITPKHLTETIKEATGKTAGEWIAEKVTLEAKVLMQNPSLNVEQISYALNFPDQSTFGKFFKNQTGLAPSVYKKTF